MAKKTYWIVAAGTGGHIFPGLNLAKALQKKDPDAEFLFFGTSDRLEARLIPSQGFKIRFLKAGKWKGSGLVGRVWGLLNIFRGMIESWMAYFENKPVALISVGGYVSVPLILATRIFRLPLFIVEPNIRAGLANRQLSRFALKGYTAPGSDALKKFHCPVADFGSPVRKDIRPVPVREKVKKILVFGGSQGALSLCRMSLELARDLAFLDKGIELEVQAGEKNLAQALEWQKEMMVEDCSRVVAFIYKVPEALAATDLAIARAGAATVSELAVAGVPTVFVPFPFAADDHQRINAKMLGDDGAAVLVDEREPEFLEKLTDSIAALTIGDGNFAKRQEMSKKFQTWGRPNADDDIADDMLSLLAKKDQNR